jgi:hypothetical protein
MMTKVQMLRQSTHDQDQEVQATTPNTVWNISKEITMKI